MIKLTEDQARSLAAKLVTVEISDVRAIEAEVLRLNGGGGEAVAMSNEAKAAVKLAYGHLWHVNNEPAAPIAIYDTEKAAYAARRQLRGLLTSQERGDAINHVGLLIGRYEAEGKNDAELDLDSNAAKPEQQRELARPVALGQSLGGGADKGSGDSKTQGKQQSVATVVGVDEYGPMLQWTTHWVELVGAKLYAAPQPQQAAPGAVMEGWQEVSTRTVSTVLQVLSDMALMEVSTKSTPSGHSIDYMQRDPVVGAIMRIRSAVSELSEFSRLSAAPKPQGE